ncbi:MAG: FMN-binding negative transcriptional regulator [Candidatus Dactylopiibacterium sp.]|nr:FMN-binding negative transcriptional regulator [Candidatus Dactylopiibacterium sp.]
MYAPPPFAEQRIEELHRIVRDNALGMLVTNTAGGLEANHLPFLLEARHGTTGALLAHAARANPLWREVRNGDAVLVVFRGAEGYITPDWYPGKHETHRRVPTWNYEVVHAHGTLHVLEDEKSLRGIVGRLTRQHEAGRPTPWKMSDAPAGFIAEMLRHIVGLEIRLTRLEGKRKLSQHHAPRDREGAIEGLQGCGQHRLAQAMRDAS